MNKRNTIFSLMIGLAVIGGFIEVSAQGRDRYNGNRDRSDRNHDGNGDRNSDHGSRSSNNQNNNYNNRDNDHHDRYNGNDNRDQRVTYNSRSGRDRDHYNYRGYERRDVRRTYYSRPVVVVPRYQQPRYVYYRDYDVYYDCRQNVYIYYSGRSWSVSNGVPMVMRHVNVRTAPRYEVNYYDDDFPRYLENNRPSYGQQCDGR
jgi:hypothetical protein